MDAWLDVRLAARACHKAALAEASGDRRAVALVAAAARVDDLQIEDVEPGTRFAIGVKGCFDRVGLLVNVDAHLPPGEREFVIAHEIGHFKLHDDPVSEVVETPAALGGDSDSAVAIVAAGYSPRERKEVQADVFATEFLCPSDWLRTELVEGRRRPSEVARELGLPERVVTAQAVRAMLLPQLRPPPPRETARDHVPDASQKVAAEWTGGPLLVEAGPGTGKTRTLVEHVLHLVAHDFEPSSMLALTFSNLAAAEMRQRIATKVDGSAAMWIGTFHAFGLEIIAQHCEAFGLPQSFDVLDQPSALELLERNLAHLPLRHYQNLYEPAYELLPILRMISRCKDEMVTPADYETAAQAALASASNDDEVLEAEKAVEFAAVYAVYEDLLREAQAVDFGDLVMKTTDLLERDTVIRERFSATYRCVLVDEYQDVNTAGARLLKALHAPGAELWVVGDQRQSIYRFRGAEPANVGRFAADFGGELRSLDWNYRSGAPVVRAIEAFAGTMGLPGNRRWTAERGQVGSTALAVAPTIAGEAAAIAARIQASIAAGVPIGDQAILARSHLTLERVTRELEKLDVPLLYLGDLFERPEIRDLLALIAIDAEYGGIGLIRVAQLPEYAATRDDARIVLRRVREEGLSVREALATIESLEGVSDAGRAGLAKLARHLQSTDRQTSAWTLLTTWLLERSDYLRPLVTSSDASARQKLVAIYHLLKACVPPLPARASSRQAFLARIRRVEALDQDKIFRRIASEASDLDAVRVLTIHASKGLEFGAVHLPAIATKYAPASWRGVAFKPPPALARLAMDKAEHEAEERSLFFVAMSRARDHLSLSRAARYKTQTATASPYLGCLAGLCPETQYPDVALRTDRIASDPPAPQTVYEERQLTLYNKCPAAYRYEVIDGLRGTTDSSAYLRFHACVYAAVGRLEEMAASGTMPTPAQAVALLDEIWTQRGPSRHPFADYYRAMANTMVRSMVEIIAAERAVRYWREEWIVDIGAGRRVSVTPDRVVETSTGEIVVQRVRTGKKTKSELGKPIYALLAAGAAQHHRGRPIRIETLYLADRSVVLPSSKDASKALVEYQDTIAAIETGRFEPSPDSRTCAACQCYFVCGA